MKGFLIIGLLSAMFVACSEKQSGDALVYAEAAIAAGNYDAAQKTSDSLLQVDKEFYATQWCRLSIVYMQLAEHNLTKEEENTAVATQCYCKAIDTDRDSANAYYSTLNVEDYARYDMLVKLANPVRDVSVEDPHGEVEIFETQE